MVNERYEDKGEAHEEEEYHFSDDQANYELEPDASKESPAAVLPPAADKNGLLAKLQSRRTLVGIIVFIILLGIVCICWRRIRLMFLLRNLQVFLQLNRQKQSHNKHQHQNRAHLNPR